VSGLRWSARLTAGGSCPVLLIVGFRSRCCLVVGYFCLLLVFACLSCLVLVGGCVMVLRWFLLGLGLMRLMGNL
jgi:hypothetical protein